MLLQRRADPRPGSVQEDLLISLGDCRNVTDLVSVSPFDVPQGHAGPLGRRLQCQDDRGHIQRGDEAYLSPIRIKVLSSVAGPS